MYSIVIVHFPLVSSSVKKIDIHTNFGILQVKIMFTYLNSELSRMYRKTGQLSVGQTKQLSCYFFKDGHTVFVDHRTINFLYKNLVP